MDTSEAMRRNAAAIAAGKTGRIFDWPKALEILTERKADRAFAGLRDDYEWTSGMIWENGKPRFDCYVFLGSTWAIPTIILDDEEEIECWRWRDSNETQSPQDVWPNLTRPQATA